MEAGVVLVSPSIPLAFCPTIRSLSDERETVIRIKRIHYTCLPDASFVCSSISTPNPMPLTTRRIRKGSTPQKPPPPQQRRNSSPRKKKKAMNDRLTSCYSLLWLFHARETPTALRMSSGPKPGPPGTISLQVSSAMRCWASSTLQFGLGSAFNHLKSSTWSYWLRTWLSASVACRYRSVTGPFAAQVGAVEGRRGERGGDSHKLPGMAQSARPHMLR